MAFVVNDCGQAIGAARIHVKSCSNVRDAENWYGPFSTLMMSVQEAERLGRPDLHFPGCCRPYKAEGVADERLAAIEHRLACVEAWIDSFGDDWRTEDDN